ncbi:MAG: glycosyltransferase family 39 protein [Sediminicola sp.]
MAIDLHYPKYASVGPRTVFCLLFLLAFIIRAPFFFRDYIDRDESTFILMGQSWVDGHLPYTELWDLKPPITFLFFAGTIYLFGKSFIAIRLLGTLLVAISSFFTYKIGKEMGGTKMGLFTGIACVALQSMFGSVQGVMSEHLSVVFLTPAVYILLRHKNIGWYGIVGILMGLTVMTKLNLAYALLVLGIYLLYTYFRDKRFWEGLVKLSVMALGTLLIILLTALPYILRDQSILWWRSVILAPLEYAAAKRHSIWDLLPTCVIVLGFVGWAWHKKYIDIKDQKVQLLLVLLIGILFSFVKGGKINGHYMVQIFPTLLVLVALALSAIPSLGRLSTRPHYFYLLLLLPMETYLEYYAVVRHKIERGSFYNGEGIEVPKYLSSQQLDDDSVLFLEYHIGYWVLNKKPPSRIATHPSNICKEEMYPFSGSPQTTPLAEIRHLLEQVKPRIVVTRNGKRIFDKLHPKEEAYTQKYLKRHYNIIKLLDRAVIHKRSK